MQLINIKDMEGNIFKKGFFILKWVISAATIKPAIPAEPRITTVKSVLNSIITKDNFKIPTRSLSHMGNPNSLNSSIMF